MPEELLRTKLFIPPARELVFRPRLLDAFSSGMTGRLILVSAPAGFGKTSLVAQWVRRSGIPTAWITLDERDNDLSRFFACVFESLRGSFPKPLAPVRRVLSSSAPIATEAVLTPLLNALAGLREDFILVLDDYHLLSAETVQAAVRFLIDHQPPCMHVAIVSRTEPSFPLARLRARAELLELRAEDLRFTETEAREFFHSIRKLELPPSAVNALTRRTEGWIAGLQMAAVLLEGHRDPIAFVRQFTGSNRYVLDYLMEEVLRLQSAELAEFMLSTSILERLSGPLCDAVTGRTDSRRLLLQMEASNLFTVKLDEAGEWFRYHSLFADTLRSRLALERAAEAPALHRRASAWFEQNGAEPEAIGHALKAQDFTRAADLIERGSERALIHCESETFIQWAESLPADVEHARPLVCVYHAFAMILAARPLRDIEEHVREARRGGESDEVSGGLAAVQAMLTYLASDPEASIRFAREALKKLPAERVYLRSTVAGTLGVVSYAAGDLDSAERAFRELLSDAERTENHSTLLLCLRRLSRIAVMRGDLARARTLGEKALASAVDENGEPFPEEAAVLLEMGELLLESGELERAESYLARGDEAARRLGARGEFDACRGRAQLLAAKGDTAGALAASRAAAELSHRLKVLEIEDLLIDEFSARLYILSGHTEDARRWAETRGLPSELMRWKSGHGWAPHYYIVQEAEFYTLARLFMADGRMEEEARSILELLLPEATRRGFVRSRIAILALLAIVLDRSGKEAESLAALGEALRLSEGQGFVRVFTELGSPMAVLLHEAARRGIRPQLAGRIMVGFPARTEVPAAGHGRDTVEPLSGRELEILGLLADGLSNKDIADRAFLSVETVKWHTSNIYGKLGVRSRTQAVAKARGLGLLVRESSIE